ncbi:uncharacterized protein LOC142563813 isoform X4 [Dermacentor variabilis]|uniref:uncharacterized protein LOC142563813 isoform X4 n=1 Tax=Dermacentor variabilis TaxID=34621 RepID=UPI003F5C34B2
MAMSDWMGRTASRRRAPHHRHHSAVFSQDSDECSYFRALDTLLIWLHRGSSWLDKLWSMQGDCRRSSHNVHRYCSRQQSDRLRRTLRTYAVLGSCGMRDQISDI